MACTRNRTFTRLVDYCRDCGLEVKTTTKARGHQGVFLHDNKDLRRIDISKNLSPDKAVPVIAHEFTHFFHHNIDSQFENLEKIFGVKEEILLDELTTVTEFVTGNTAELTARKELQKVKNKIREQESIIKSKYPNFKRSEKFLKFENYIKNSAAKYLLKYDKVKVISHFQYVIYSVDNLKRDFPDMPEEYAAYINLRSLQRLQSRYSRKLRGLKRYYAKPAELFARFVEALVIDRDKVAELAPEAYEAFKERLEFKAFRNLKNFLDIALENECETFASL